MTSMSEEEEKELKIKPLGIPPKLLEEAFEKPIKKIERFPNWRKAIAGSRTLSTVLAGFSVTLIALLLKENIGSTIFTDTDFIRLTFNQAGCIGFAFAFILFLFASQSFHYSEMHNVYELDKETWATYKKQLGKNWESYKKEKDSTSRRWHEIGANLYDLGLLCFFGALTITLWNYGILGWISLGGLCIEFFVYIISFFQKWQQRPLK